MIGSIVLTLALASSVIAMAMYFLTFKGYKNAINFGRIAYHSMAILVFTAATILLYNILTHNYGLKYVYDYSSNELPKGILAATFWAGQEGSFMLWLFLTSIVGLILQSYASKRGDLEQRVMVVFTLATTFLLVMVSPLFKSPFTYIWAEPVFVAVKNINPTFLSQSWIQSFMFSDGSSGQNFIKMNADLYNTLMATGIPIKQFIIDGKGLNPQLMNFWMQIHPPILFTGFSMATVPFSFAMAALMKNDYRDWVKQSFPWVLAGAGILGLGIMLGGYWAYEMLGWGGYWAWDPVENSSLIPWLVGVASIHTLLVQRKSQAKGGGIGKFAKTNLILCIMTYVLVLYSTFLTRSGILGDASVHSFVDPGMLVYLFLVVFIGTFIVVGFGSIAYRWKYLTEHQAVEEGLLSRDFALFTATIVLSASAVIVLVGTSAPIFGHSVDKFFYNEMHLPIAIIIGLLNGLSLLLKWKDTKGQELIKKSIPSIVIAFLFTVLVVLFGKVTELMMIILTFSSAFALVVNLEIAIKIVKGNMKMLGAYVAHIGIAFFILGVIGSSAYSEEVNIDLVKNQPTEAFGYKMVFTGYQPIENGTKYAFNVNMTKGNKTYIVSPIMYISDFNNGLMREPAILTLPTKDFYLSPLGYEENGNDNQQGTDVSLSKGQEKEVDGIKIVYKEFVKPDIAAMQSGGNIKMGTNLVITQNGKSYSVEPLIKRENGQFEYIPATVDELNLKIELKKINPSDDTADFLVSKIKSVAKTEAPKEVLSVAASVKPFINLVWVGVLIMVVGFFVAVARRLKESFV